MKPHTKFPIHPLAFARAIHGPAIAHLQRAGLHGTKLYGRMLTEHNLSGTPVAGVAHHITRAHVAASHRFLTDKIAGGGPEGKAAGIVLQHLGQHFALPQQPTS